MSDIISLSSSDEEKNKRPRKRIKPTPVVEVKSAPCTSDTDTVIISSDEEMESYENLTESPSASMNLNSCKSEILENCNGEDLVKIELDSSSENCIVNNHCAASSVTILSPDNVVSANIITSDDSMSSDDTNVQNDDHIDENIPNSESVDVDCNGPSANDLDTSVISEPSDKQTIDEMDEFLKACSRSIEHTKYEGLKEKYHILNDHYQKYILNIGYNDEVAAFLQEHTTKASSSPADAVLTYNEVLEYFKSSVVDEVDIAPEYRKKVKVLMETCIKILKRIKKLESAVVDWDDDNNSAYIQEDRYKKRLIKVFNLYCKYMKMNPYQGRLTYKKFNFTSSKYREINAVINKNCQKKGKFPTYNDIEKIVRKCVRDHHLRLSESKIRKESEKCFKILGKFLQKRRKQELYESHFYFIKDSNDPASSDEQLDKCLKTSFTEGMKKIEMICEKYAEKQTRDSQVEPSEDSATEITESSDDSDSS